LVGSGVRLVRARRNPCWLQSVLVAEAAAVVELRPGGEAMTRRWFRPSRPRRAHLRRSLLALAATLSLLVTGINAPPAQSSEPTAVSARTGAACPTPDEVKADRKRWIAEPTIRIIGQQAVATFRPTLPPECPPVTVTLVTYGTDGLNFVRFATSQRVFDHHSGTTGPLQADLPPCFLQADLILGGPGEIIDSFDPPKVTYSARRQLLTGREGGQDCTLPPDTNRPPTVDDQQVKTAEDTAVAIGLRASDPDGDSIAYGITKPPTHGTLTGTAPALTYTPAKDFNGGDSFTVKASDGKALSPPGTVTIAVSDVNDSPALSPDRFTTAGNGEASTSRPQCSGDCGVIYGDPYIYSFDRANTSFQAVGEFTAVKSTVDDFEAQVRLAPVPGLRTFSLPVAVALRVGGHRITIYRTSTGTDTRIDGRSVTLSRTPLLLPGGGTVASYVDADSGTSILEQKVVTWPDGSFAVIDSMGIDPRLYRLTTAFHLASERHQQVVGLLGNFDTDATNDHITRAGEPIQEPPSFSDKYKKWGHSWRISQDESLFDYGPGQTTETFTDRSFPDEPFTVDDLSPAARASGEAACRSFGVRDTAPNTACVLDVGVTGDADFANSAASAQEAAHGVPVDSGAIDIGASTTISLGTPGERGARSFVAAAGQKVTLTISDNTIPEVSVTLRSPAGTSVGGGRVTSPTWFFDTMTLPDAGTYILEIDPGAQGTGSMKIQLSEVPPNSGSTVVGAPTTVTLKTPGENAARAFPGKAGQRTTLTISENTIPKARIAVRAPNGQTIAGGTVGSASHLFETFTLPADGTYTVEVDPEGQGTGGLTFLLSEVPPNEGTTGVGVSSTVSITVAGENAQRSFTGTAGQLLTLKVSGNTIDGVWVVVRDPSGRTVGGGAVGSQPTAFFDTFQLPVDGNYTVVVDPSGEATGKLSFLLSAVPARPSIVSPRPATTIRLPNRPSAAPTPHGIVGSAPRAPPTHAALGPVTALAASAHVLTLRDADLLKNDKPGPPDESNQTLSVTGVTSSAATHGTVSRSADGIISYTPDPDYTGLASFSYTACDDGSTAGRPDHQCASSTVAITVVPNEAPDADDKQLTTTEDAPAQVVLSGSDAENDPLIYSMARSPGHGSVLGNPPTLTYTPPPDFNGSDSFTFTASDQQATSIPATVAIKITEINDLPVLGADRLTAGPDEPLTMTAAILTANDSPGPGDEATQTLTITAVQASADTHGTLDRAPSGAIIYTPTPGFTGAAEFTYRACDNGTTNAQLDPKCATGTVTLTVAANAPPTAGAAAIIVRQGRPTPVTLRGSDPEGDPLTYKITSTPQHGTLRGNAPNLVFTPSAGFFGTDAFTFTVADGNTTSAPATITLDIQKTISPQITADAATVRPGASVLVDVLTNDQTGNGTLSPATLAIVTQPKHGTAAVEDAAIRYTPAAGSTDDTFTYKVCDRLQLCGQAEVTITVKGPNRPPVATDDRYDIEVDGSLQVPAPGVQANDRDPDPEDAITARLVTGVGAGRLLLNGSGAFTYTPAQGFAGSDFFTYRLVDRAGAQSAPATVAITITRGGLLAADDAYTTSRDNPLDVPAPGILGNDSDTRHSGLLTAVLESGPRHGTVALNPDGSFDYSPDPDFEGADSFAYTAVNLPGARSLPGRVTLTVGSPEGPPPTIKLLSPEDGSRVGAPQPVAADISPPPGQSIRTWSVGYRNLDQGSPIQLASGTGAPPRTLAMFDPTLLTNGTYQIRVRAQASGGGSDTATSSVLVAGDLKLGDYATTYLDMEATLGGIPVQVLRTYDTTDKRRGDFGIGWRIELSSYRASPNDRLGLGGWTSQPFGSPFTRLRFASSKPHHVTVTSPTGSVEVFDLVPAPTSPLLGLTTPAFVRRKGSGSTSTLEDANPPTLALANGSLREFLTGVVYDPRLFKLTTKAGVTFVIDRFEGLRSVTDRNGNELVVTDDGVHSGATDRLAFIRDGAGRITSIQGPGNQKTSYAYSDRGDLTTFTRLNGAQETFTYDSHHHLIGIEGPGDAPLRTLIYDSAGRVSAIKDAAGNTTTIKGDIPGRRELVTSPSGRLNRISTYDDAGNLVSVENAFEGESQVTRFQYDAETRLVRTIDPLGHVSTLGYDAEGNLTSETTPSGKTRRTTYNNLNLPTTVVAADGKTVESTTYDAEGNAVSTSFGDGLVTTFSYDSAGRITAIKKPNGTTSVDYDQNSRVEAITDPMGGRVEYQYDDKGNMTAVTDQLGATTRFAYNELGELTSLTTANGATRRLDYDPLGRLLTETDPLGEVTRYSYDTAGRLVAVTDRAGDVTRFAYDRDGNLTRRMLPSGEEVTLESDPLGRPSTMSDADTVVSYTYDAGGRVATERSRGNGGVSLPDVTLSYLYDPDGSIKQRNGPGGRTIFDYDDRSRPTGITNARNERFQLTYDNADRLISLTRPNGVVDTLAYGAFGELRSRTSQRGGTLLAKTQYGVDALLRRTTMQDQDGTHGFAYDKAGRLTSATHPPASGLPSQQFRYDQVGNRIAPTTAPGAQYSYDAGSRLLADDRFNYAYDPEGRLIRRVERSTGATTTYDWNASGQLISVTNPDGTRSTFRYDPLGRRVESATNNRITRHAYSGWNVHLEYDRANALKATYTVGSEPGDIFEVTRNDTPRYPLVDGIGSTIGLTDASGKVIGRTRYAVFGEPTTTGAFEPAYSYAGHQYDDQSGLHYMRARYHDDNSGRFLSEDPLISLNCYSYADGAPTNRTDRFGLAATTEYEIRWHHIAAQRARAAAPARAAVRRCLGSRHAIENLIPIPQIVHGPLHTKAYYKMVNDLLAGQPCAVVLKMLSLLAEMIFSIA
jgi:RHS repeat-associated protein